MEATYSPDDNKLRLYSFGRLDSETYARVKDAGFKWAPKQELFVAPMWTPAREDLLIELCGEIGDEDKSMGERAEERADRFEDYSEKRAKDADRAHKAVKGIMETARHPTPDEVKATRLAAGMTQTDAARSIHCTLTAWQRWEYGERKMHPAMWELFQLKVGRLTQV